MTHRLPRTLTALLCASAAAGLAACSAAGGSSTVSSDSAPASSASAAADPTAGLPTGTALKAKLLPLSALPKTLKADPSGDRDTGGDFSQPTDEKVATAKACQALNATNWISATGLGSSSFAQTDAVDRYDNMFGQQLDAFEGDGAQQAMTRIRAVFKACKSFTIKQGSQSFKSKLTAKTLSGLGDDAVEAVITSPDFEGGTTLVAVRVGKVVVTSVTSDQKTDGGYGVGLTRKLVARLG